MVLDVSRIITLYMKNIFFSDFRNALQAIQKGCTHHPLDPILQQILFQLHIQKKAICFCWVPSCWHPQKGSSWQSSQSGCNSSDNLQVLPSSKYPEGKRCIPANDYCSYFYQGFITCWQKCWREDNRGYKLWNVKPWQFSYCISQLGKVILTCLRIGDTNLTHSYHMSREYSPICWLCLSCAPLSVHHIFVGYTAMKTSILKYQPEICKIRSAKCLLFILSEPLTQFLTSYLNFIQHLRSNSSSTLYFLLCLGVDKRVGVLT